MLRSACENFSVGSFSRIEIARTELERSKRKVGSEITLVGFDALAENLPRGLMAQITQHGNARTVAAQRIMQVSELAHMRHFIEREGHIARPGVGDLHAR